MSRVAWIAVLLSIAPWLGCTTPGVAPGASLEDAGEEQGADGGSEPECRLNQDCASDQRCDAEGVCISGSGGEVGDSCTVGNQCAQGSNRECLLDSDGFPAGYCVSECSNNNCQGSSTCVSGLGAGSASSVCVATCTSSADCRAKYQCVPLSDGLGVCMPPCANTSVCGDGQTCETATGLCRTACTSNSQCPLSQVCNTTERVCEELPPDAGSGDINAGTVTKTMLGEVNGTGSVSIAAPAPENAVSSFFIAQSTGPQFFPWVQLSFLREPGGTTVYGGSNDIMKVSSSGDTISGVLYPNAPPPRVTNNTNNLPGLPYSPGDFTVGFRSQPITKLSMTVLTKTVVGELTGGTIDVNLWFDSARLNAQTARSSSSFQSALRTIQAIWSAAGIRMGKVTYLDLPDPSRSYRNIQGQEVLVISALTGEAPNDGVNWIFVDSIDSAGSGGSTTLGIAAGIPGTPLRGTGQSGVAVNLSALQNGGAQTLATTIAHETGHWLGLFHTTEATGTEFDPILDTPQCPASSYDRDRDENVDDRECSNMDGTNLMFWLSDSTGQRPHTTITADQKYVLLRNPTLH